MSLAAAASTGAGETQMPGAFVRGTGTAATEAPARTSLDRERQSGDGYLYSASSRVMNRAKIVFLVQSGDRAEREFDLGDTVIQVKQSLLANWPENFAIKPTDTSDLRILYRGHFLDDKDTLSDSKLHQSNTVVHLTVKPPNNQNKTAKKDIDKAPKCACIIL